MLTARRSIGFKYRFIWKWWVRVGSVADREVARTIGRAMLRYPRFIQPPDSPQHLVGQLLIALAKYKLDGGYTHEVLGDDSYRVTIVVDARREKPKS